ncbi:MAG: TauD/TfdA family dioxygenase [Rhodospirillaceae bacterium]|jgi:taurine dioxygenase|nr:TauD/TfdA family dioxygenase [Rhodospirillaceae bacterium]MBT5899027.1 TauD/TfdA family dioxygenase [Rhodospirillaceae bacterium]MBT6427522.1 TauD/TfdA family dioxygenase [Rhodospirillaceae bacterium]MBT7761058.1 TauD/TfdA family dioxygenase [Rhodospirillaceae bacterium]
MGVEVRKLSDRLGAEVVGLDPSQPLEESEFDDVANAFREHLVLVFRDQPLEAEQFSDFARNFGELQPHVTKRYRHPEHPEIVYMTNVNADGSYDKAGAERGALAWHSDLAYDAVPAKCTLLHPLALPDRGGNTKFANMYLAYETMPPALRNRIDGLEAEFRYGGRHGWSVEVLDEADKSVPNVVHPVVRTHPETGRKSVYVNPYHTVAVVGMARTDSDELLDEIFEWGSRPEFQWEHAWQLGDTLVWENRCAWHRGPRDYPTDQRRIFLRTTVRGTVTSL